MRVLCLTLVVALSYSGSVRAQSPDFDRFVVIGDSFSAGFSDGGLVESNQHRNIPTTFLLLAGQDPAGFEQPLVSAPGIPPLLELISVDPLQIAPQQGSGTPLNSSLARSYDNLAVPGFRVDDVVNNTGGAPLADLVLRGMGTALNQALSLNPTTTLVWIGNNDALGAMTSGIVIDGITLTPSAEFENALRTLIESLVNSGSTVLLVPVIETATAFPFVRFLPNVVTDSNGDPILVNGDPVPLIGPDGPLSGDDAVLLSASGLLDQGDGVPVAQGGTGQPLPDQAVLSAAEVSMIETRIQAYNAVLQQIALDQPDGTTRVLPDPTPIFTALEAGENIKNLSGEFPNGGFFSLDGVHPTADGYEVIAEALFAPLVAAEPRPVPTLSPGLLVALMLLIGFSLLRYRRSTPDSARRIQ